LAPDNYLKFGVTLAFRRGKMDTNFRVVRLGRRLGYMFRIGFVLLQRVMRLLKSLLELDPVYRLR
jgi:hypothetical protein